MDSELTLEKLFFGLNDCDFRELLLEAFILWFRQPEIYRRLAADILLQASQAKERRMLEKQYLLRNQPWLEGVEHSSTDTIWHIKSGRPRKLNEEGIFTFIILNGYLGSFSDAKNYQRLIDSDFLKVFLPRIGVSKVPSRQCLLDSLALVSGQTLEFLFDQQILMGESDGLICLEYLLSDSTFVAANSCWPTDSKLIFRLMQKGRNISAKLAMLLGGNIPRFPAARFGEWLSLLESCDFQIALCNNKKDAKKTRKILYREIIKVMRRCSNWLSRSHEFLLEKFNSREFSPAQTEMLQQRLCMLEEAIIFAEITHDNIIERIFEGNKVPACERIFSIADKDAYMVCKGQREPVIGYRPTYTITRNGICVDIHLQKGNPSDNDIFADLAKRLKEKYPNLLKWSLDDGYSSKANYKLATETIGIEKLSLSGAKGKNATPQQLYDSQEYKTMRNDRSAVESHIGTGKAVYRMERLSSRGLPQAKRELTIKSLAANFRKLSRLRQEPAAQAA